MIEVSFTGAQAISDMLAQYTDPQLSKRAQRATKAGAQVLAAPLRAAVEPLSKRMARSVYVHVAKRDKPAYFVGHHTRIAFFWPMVIGGTRDHSLAPRNGSGSRSSYPYVRGVKPHPVIGAVAEAYAQAVYNAVLADISKDT